MSPVSFALAPVTGRIIGRVPMRVLLGMALIVVTAGAASMARLTASSTWLVLLPKFILVGIGLGLTSTALSPATLGAVEPGRAGWPLAWSTRCGRSVRRPA